jgi:Putative stress-induced transcription regulator
VALDVAHTGGVGDWVDADLVVDEAALAYWLGTLLERQVAPGPGLADFRELREAMFRCGRNHVAGRRFHRRNVDVLNRLATGPCLPSAIDTSGAAVLPVVSVD